MKFGVQLYSLREKAEREGAEAVFAAVSAAGYDGVEFAGFYGKTPAEIAALCEKYHLEPVSAHIRSEAVEESLPYIDALGIRYVFIPWAGLEELETPEKYAAFLEAAARAKELLSARGVVFGYHNHAHEFEGGRELITKIAADADISAELDVFWATVAGRDAVKEMKKLEGKLALVHIKEAAAVSPAESAQPVVGEGAVDMRGVFAEAARQGIPWALLEVEKYPCPEDEYLKKSLVNMKKLSK